MNRKILLIFLSILVIGVVGWFAYEQLKEDEAPINDFAACAAKYPVQESYPERCSVPGGKSFTNPSQSLN